MERRIRILLAKPGLDGHDRGIKVIAAAFRDAGFEVIYTGLRQTPETIVEAAIQEDVDAIGMSILSGAHMTLFPRVLSLLKEKNAEQILLFGGGIIPEEDVQKLKGMGVGMLFTPGTTTTEAIEYVKNEVGKRRKEEKIL
jgi:methylmalonyl-CoA mutase C-terminal domain/subunit